MNILMQRRAEIAFRSLSKMEKEKIAAAISVLSAVDCTKLRQEQNLHKLAVGRSDKELYVYRGTSNLRLIISLDDDTCSIEDIVDRDRLNQLISQRGQE
jgi:hypothetical protein